MHRLQAAPRAAFSLPGVRGGFSVARGRLALKETARRADKSDEPMGGTPRAVFTGARQTSKETVMTKGIFWAVAGALLLAGCSSQIPYATTYKMTGQHKMQAAEHWNILAADVADRVRAALDDRVELRLLAVDVSTDQEQGPFHKVFKELLVSQLVQRGVQVPERQENQLELVYSVQVLRHNGRFQRPPPGLLTLLGAGVAVSRDITTEFIYGAAGAGLLLDVAAGHLTSHSDQEVVITTRLVWKNRYVVHASDIYYINDADNLHYGEPLAPYGMAEVDPLEGIQAKTMGVRNE